MKALDGTTTKVLTSLRHCAPQIKRKTKWKGPLPAPDISGERCRCKGEASGLNDGRELRCANAISCSPSPRVANPIPTARRKSVITIEKVSGIADTCNCRCKGREIFRESKYRAGSRMGREGVMHAETALACLRACVRACALDQYPHPYP